MDITRDTFPKLQLNRTSLKDQTARLLRDLIVKGRIAAGSKITERDVADLLNISRMPARDALLELERQGLVVSKPGGRYVIQLDEEGVRHLYQIRLALEQLAVELAAQRITPGGKDALQRQLDAMRRAVDANDPEGYVASDLEMHALIWQQAQNPYLLDMLHAMIGPIFMFIATQTRVQENWRETLELHEALCRAIGDRDTPGALHWIEAHMQRSLALAVEVFQKKEVIR
jgi:DNA-binding GntR family transcriptional regulator